MSFFGDNESAMGCDYYSAILKDIKEIKKVPDRIDDSS